MKTLSQFLLLPVMWIVFLLCLPAAAQDITIPAKAQRQRESGLPQINVIDKFLAIEAALGTHLNRTSEDQWIKDYDGLYQKFMRDGDIATLPGGGQDVVINALMLGIKGSDAVLALKARNVEATNLSAEQIEQLALKLGASKKELAMADTVKKYVNAGRWLDAFLALGYLQRNVLNFLRENPDLKPQAVLVIVGGWLQGGRCVTDVVALNYGPELSNILREPRLVMLIQQEMEQLPPEYQSNAVVAKITGLLPEIKNRVSVGLRDPVKLENVQWLYTTFNSLVTEIAPKGSSQNSAPPAVPPGGKPADK